jgi:hypothetical protein
MGLVFKNLNRDNIKITPYTAHKQWTAVDQAAAAALGITVYDGQYITGDFNISDPDFGTAQTEATTSNGHYKKLVHASINRLYYDGNDNAYDTYCNMNPIEQIREINEKVTVLSIPQQIFGDAIKPGTFQLTFNPSQSVGGYNEGGNYFGGGNSIIKDDGQGNLYESVDVLNVGDRYINPTASLIDVNYHENYKYSAMPGGGGFTSSDGTWNDIHVPYIKQRVDGKFGCWGESYNSQPMNESAGGSYYGAAVRYHGRTGKTGQSQIPHKTSDLSSPLDLASIAPTHSSQQDMSYTAIRNSGNMEFDDDFTICIRFSRSGNPPTTHSFSGPIDTATGRRTARAHPWATVITKEEWSGGHCPFSIKLNLDNDKLYATRRSKAGGQTQISSSAAVVNGFNSVVFIKSGNTLSLSLNQATFQTAVDLAHGLTTTTKTPIHIGARRYGKRASVDVEIGDGNNKRIRKKWKYTNHIAPLFGHVDEVKIYDTVITTQELKSHFKPYGQKGNSSPKIGNIMYEHGLVVITTPGNSNKGFYHQAPSIFSDLKFKGSHDLTEHVYICNVLDGEYNSTENITVREKHDPRNANLQKHVTGSEWSPYITTVGLYDKKNNLCAIGKMAQAIKNPSDYDLSFMVRFDTNSY